MFNLSDPKLPFILFSPEKKGNHPIDNNIACERVCSILYSKDYTVIPLQSYFKERYDRSFIAISTDRDPNQLRKDAIFLIENFDQESIIVKYFGDDQPTKINFDGSERPLLLAIYESAESNKVYLYNGISFSFNEQKRYFFPKKKEDLKAGMIVEYLNDNQWKAKQIFNLDSEYEKMYKLLIKYEKIRVACS